MGKTTRKNSIQELRIEVETCTRCRLHKERLKPVLGEGNLYSPVVLIGEAPGKKEDEVGRPFVGLAGKRLTKMLTKVGLSRGDVYITNIVKCRPPNNRQPRTDEIKTCTQYLDRQLSLLTPKIIVPMGNSSIAYFLKKFNLKKVPIGDIHGSPFSVNTNWGHVKIFPLYHPAALLYNQTLESELMNDFEKLSKLITKEEIFD